MERNVNAYFLKQFEQTVKSFFSVKNKKTVQNEILSLIFLLLSFAFFHEYFQTNLSTP